MKAMTIDNNSLESFLLSLVILFFLQRLRFISVSEKRITEFLWVGVDLITRFTSSIKIQVLKFYARRTTETICNMHQLFNHTFPLYIEMYGKQKNLWILTIKTRPTLTDTLYLSISSPSLYRLEATICSKCCTTPTSPTTPQCLCMKIGLPVGLTRWTIRSSMTVWSLHALPDLIQVIYKYSLHSR